MICSSKAQWEGKKQERAQETENEEEDGREDFSRSTNWKHGCFFWFLSLGITETRRHLERSDLLAFNGLEAYRFKMKLTKTHIRSNIDVAIYKMISYVLL